MNVQENTNYTAILNKEDIAKIIEGKSVTFWIMIGDLNEISFELKKESL